jgi:hypothetical protein
MPSTMCKNIVNFVAKLGGGGEDAHDRKERSAARGGKLLPFMEGEGGGGSREGRKKLFDPISDFRKPNPPCLRETSVGELRSGQNLEELGCTYMGH